MRVISGECKGRKLKGEGDRSIRPTSDMVKSAIFNILPLDFTDYAVLDLFAGTGALGIEALSRGARLCVFIDAGRPAFRAIKDNLRACDLMSRGQMIAKKVNPALKLLAERGLLFDLVFMDPPYEQNLVDPALKLLTELKLLCDDATVVVEHAPGEPMAETYGSLYLRDKRKYGSTCVAFYEHENNRTNESPSSTKPDLPDLKEEQNDE